MTRNGPKLRNVSKLLARVRKRGFRRRMSSAVMSIAGRKPAMTLCASLREIVLAPTADHHRKLCLAGDAIGLREGRSIAWPPNSTPPAA